MRVLICGGRDYTDVGRVYAALDHLHAKRGITLLIHGDCPTGADKLADDWADSRNVDRHPEPADWDQYGRRAGPIRNTKMLTLNPEGVVAFPGGDGTADMVKKALNAGLKVWRPYG